MRANTIFGANSLVGVPLSGAGQAAGGWVVLVGFGVLARDGRFDSILGFGTPCASIGEARGLYDFDVFIYAFYDRGSLAQRSDDNASVPRETQKRRVVALFAAQSAPARRSRMPPP